jgi:hypothetical protein
MNHHDHHFCAAPQFASDRLGSTLLLLSCKIKAHFQHCQRKVSSSHTSSPNPRTVNFVAMAAPPHVPTVSKELPLPDVHHLCEKDQSIPARSKLDLAITKAKHKRSTSWSTFPCSLWFETNAKVKVYRINHQNCKFKHEREWQGVIIGKGIHGSINTLLAWFKHKNKALKTSTPLMGLLTVCVECCGELDFWYKADHMDQIINRTSGSLILGLSDKEVEKVASSKAIIMEGALMNVIKTVAIDGQWKQWPILTPVFKN